MNIIKGPREGNKSPITHKGRTDGFQIAGFDGFREVKPKGVC